MGKDIGYAVAFIVGGLLLLIAYAEVQQPVAQNESCVMECEQAAHVGGITLVIDTVATEQQALAYMHKMTHQKVRAEKKWGAVPMNEANITAVTQAVEASNWSCKDVLLPILRRWQTADFSQADEDHNTIWQLQGGVVGKAYGLLTTEEEAQFIADHFGT